MQFHFKTINCSICKLMDLLEVLVFLKLIPLGGP